MEFEAGIHLCSDAVPVRRRYREPEVDGARGWGEVLSGKARQGQLYSTPNQIRLKMARITHTESLCCVKGD